MADSTQTPPASKTIDAAILIAMASALAYAFSMSFECGYGSFFGVPPKLIEANPKNILVCAATVFFALPGGIYLWDSLGMVWPRRWAPAIKRMLIGILLMPSTALVIYFFFAIRPLALTILILPWFIWLLLSELVIPLIAHREKPTLAAKLDAAKEHSAIEFDKSPTLSMSLMKRFGVKPFGYTLWIFGVCVFAYGFGFRNARTQESFLVTAVNGEPCVFVTSYLDSLICAHIDATTHKLTDHLSFVHIPELDFELQKVGLLTAADSNDLAPKPSPPTVKKSVNAVESARSPR